MRDAPRLGPGDRPLISQWVDDHYILRDESGERIRLKRHGSSSLIAKSRAAISSEFFLITTLKQGKNYALDFIPHVSEPNQYRHAFTAPSDEQDPWHMHFELFEED